MSEKNFLSSAVESIAVEFGVDGAYEAIQKDGFLGAAENAYQKKKEEITSAINKAGEKVGEVKGYLKEDIQALGHTLFDSKEEKEAKRKEEEAKKAKAEAEQKAKEEAAAARRAELDKSYILHTAMIVCDKAYTMDAYNPSYLVVPKSHGELTHGLPQLNVGDYKANVNVLDFGICRSPKNPKVQEAAKKILDEVKTKSQSWTDKLMSIFVDDDCANVCDTEESLAAYCAAPCCPQIWSEWTEGKEDVLIEGKPALLGRCTLKCAYGGTITIESSGQPEP